jgi:DNA-binding transcriptional ArsR family regulator
MAGSATPKARKPEFLIDKEKIKQAKFVFRAFNHTIRQKLLKLLHKNTEMKVTDIYKKLKRTQSETSLHLAILRRAGLVCFRKDGKKIYYSVNYERISEVQIKATALVNF